MGTQFEWDESKAETNLRKHGVSFREAGTVFSDPMATTVPDPKHSNSETRHVTVGRSLLGRMLVAVHTNREGRIRIISARCVTRQERNWYEEA